MSDLKPLRCKVCGAPLNPKTLRCSYCGMYHKWDGDYVVPRTIIHTVDAKVNVLQAATRIPHEYAISMSQDEIQRYVRSGICRKIAEALEPNIEYEMCDSPYDRTTVIKGRVRVVEPGFRF